MGRKSMKEEGKPWRKMIGIASFLFENKEAK
jgi:hypothetical protein